MVANAMTSTFEEETVIPSTATLDVAPEVAANDALEMTAALEAQATDSVVQKERKGIAAWWHSLIHGNVDRTFEKPVDMTIAGSPYYSQESGFGIGGQVSALYRLNRTDSVMQPSDFSLMGGISTSGSYSFGFEGNTHFTRDKRFSYRVVFKNQRHNFWGVNYETCTTNDHINAKFRRIEARLDYRQRFYRHWFWGAVLNIDYGKAYLDDYSYLNGLDNNGFYTGVGGLVTYDSRDYALNPKKGMYFLTRVIYYPQYLGAAENANFKATVQFDTYQHIWQGGMLAWDFLARYTITKGEAPWQLREEISHDDRQMRGYYTGCITDHSQLCAQVELRQHIYKRLGCVAWVGGGSFFKNKINHFLPNAGVGLRFEFKANTNIRMDFGVGRKNAGICFGFGEAF